MVPITLESGPPGLLAIAIATLVMAVTRKTGWPLRSALLPLAGYRAFLVG
jgi:hypothetical protein